MPITDFHVAEKYKYLDGFGNYHQSEAVPGANPIAANSPQIPPYECSTERISGSSFTAPRALNLQTWLYRVVPSLKHGDFERYEAAESSSLEETKLHLTPSAKRWGNFPTDPGLDWVSSQRLLARSGDPSTKTGLGYLVYAASEDMAPNTVFFSSDGDFLIVPQSGTLDIQTELGHLLVRQNEIAVLPRGIRYRVTLPSGPARGYICELYQGHFQLPELGPLGSCSLANARDFQVPVAYFEGTVSNGVTIANTVKTEWTIITRFAGVPFACKQDHTPFDIVAWQGSYYPYKYDLSKYSVIGSILYDHPDPSIFTVLTAPSHREPGTAVIDFAIFPPRWLMMENTYWPPYFHRNSMSEFAGAIINDQNPASAWNQAKTFVPFGAQLNSSMVPHGMDEKTHEAARVQELKPEKTATDGFMVFLWESEAMMGVTNWGMDAAAGQFVDSRAIKSTYLSKNASKL